MEGPEGFSLADFFRGSIIPPAQAAALQSGQAWKTSSSQVDVEAQLQAFASAAAARAATSLASPPPATTAPSPQAQRMQQENQGEQPQHDVPGTSAGPQHQEVEDAHHAVANLTAALAGDTPSKSGKAQRASPLLLQQSPQKSTSRSPPVIFPASGAVAPTQHVSPARAPGQISPARKPLATVQASVHTDGTAPMSIDEPAPMPQEEPLPKQVPDLEVALLPMTQDIPFGGTPPREKVADIIEGSGQGRGTQPGGATRTRAGNNIATTTNAQQRGEKPSPLPPSDKSTPPLLSPTSASKAKAKGWLGSWGINKIFGRSPLAAEPEPEPAPQQPGQDSIAPEIEEGVEHAGMTSDSAKEGGNEQQQPQRRTRMQAESIPATQILSPADKSLVEEDEEDEGDAAAAPEEDVLDIPPTQFIFSTPHTATQEGVVGTATGSALDASFGPAEATAALGVQQEQVPTEGHGTESESQDDHDEDDDNADAGMPQQRLGGVAAAEEPGARTGETAPSRSPAPPALFPASSAAVQASPGTLRAGAPAELVGHIFTQDPNMMTTQDDVHNVGGWAHPASAPSPRAGEAHRSPAAAPQGEIGGLVGHQEDEEEEEEEEMPMPEQVGTRRTRATAALVHEGMEYRQRKRAKPTAIAPRKDQEQMQQQQQQPGASEAPQAAGVYMVPQLPSPAVPVAPIAGNNGAPPAPGPRHGTPINIPKSTLAARRKLQELRAQRQSQAAAAASAHGYGAQGGYPMMPQPAAMPGPPAWYGAPPPHTLQTPGNPAMIPLLNMNVHTMAQGMPQYAPAPYYVRAGGYAMQMMPPPLPGGQYTAATPSAQQGSAMGPPQFAHFVHPGSTGQSSLGKMLSILAPPQSRGP